MRDGRRDSGVRGERREKKIGLGRKEEKNFGKEKEA